MTTLWEQTQDGTHYSVRAAGASVRLYSNRVFHSQWNPHRPFSGGVWDCLTLPVLYRSRDTLRRVLLLGLGGGAAVRQLQVLLPHSDIVAVEIDPVHIDIARRWFGVQDDQVSLLCEDAIDWVARQRNAACFDVIIDDLFGHADGEPVRALPLERDWLAALAALLNPQGLLIGNSICARDARKARAAFAAAGLVWQSLWSQRQYDNRILATSRERLCGNQWRENLAVLGLPARIEREAGRVIRRQMSPMGRCG